MHGSIGARGDDVFLGQRLDAVGNRLKKAERADAVRPQPILDAGQSLALEDCGQREERRKEADDGRHAEQHAGRRLPRRGKKTDQPVPEQNEDLIQSLDHRLRSLVGDGRGFGCGYAGRGLVLGVGLDFLRG